MATYKATLSTVGSTFTIQEILESLRGLGSVELACEFEFPNRRTAVRELGDEYGWLGYDREFWDARLSGSRKRVAP